MDEDWVAAAEAKFRELVELGREQQRLVGREDAVVCLNVRGNPWGKATNRRLWPGGPSARIIADAPEGDGVLVMIGAPPLIAAAERQLALIALARGGVTVSQPMSEQIEEGAT